MQADETVADRLITDEHWTTEETINVHGELKCENLGKITLSEELVTRLKVMQKRGLSHDRIEAFIMEKLKV